MLYLVMRAWMLFLHNKFYFNIISFPCSGKWESSVGFTSSCAAPLTVNKTILTAGKEPISLRQYLNPPDEPLRFL